MSILYGNITHLITNYAHVFAQYQYQSQAVLKLLEQGKDNEAFSLKLLNSLIWSTYDQGRYADAIIYAEEEFIIKEKILGAEHPEIALLHEGLAHIYYSQGIFNKAKFHYNSALNIRVKIFEYDHLDVARSINNLAGLYFSLGRYSEAEPLLKRALAIREKKLGPYHPNVANSLNDLATLYSQQHQYAKADTLYQRALYIVEEFMEPDHIYVAYCLVNLASLYTSLGRYTEAELLHKRALSISEKALGVEHPHVARSIYSLAVLFDNMGRSSAAELQYKRALAIREKVLGPDHPDVASSLNGLASLYTDTNVPEKALPLMIRVFLIDEHIIENVFAAASERVKFTFLNTLNYRYEWFINLTCQELENNIKAVTYSFDATLRRKGLVLDALARERMSLIGSDNPETVQTAEQLRAISSQLANLTLAGPGEKAPDIYRQNLVQLETEREELEEKLTRLSLAYVAEKEVRKADHKTVAKLLPAGSALVEMVAYRTFNFKATGNQKKWGDYQYNAFILPAGENSQPMLVDLGQAADIDEAVREFRKEMSQAVERINQLGDLKAEQRLAEKSKKLYKLVFAPIEKALGKIKTLYISPDGDLNLIPFGVLQDTSDQYLAEKYQINYISCGRDIVRFGKEIGQGKGIVIMADPDFNMSGQMRLAEAKQTLAEPVLIAMRSAGVQRSIDLKTAEWEQLPGTKDEAKAIANIFAGRDVKAYSGGEASEKVFKELRSPKMLHIATHGFFLEDEDKSELYEQAERMRALQVTARPDFGPAVKIENPLLRSGLALAGANRLGKEELPEGAEDGILTALEISGMNFWGTDLVVLSACETGVGETRRGEGVFGLRRAFQLAGAKTVVMSLWKVPDEETRELMVDFYKRMQAGEDKARALQNAQLSMMKVRREKYGAAHPFFWGAFVCVGDPE